jgi:hypothetical protein
MGGGSMRIFGSEVSQQIEHGLNAANTPDALYKLVSNVGGQVNRGLDMVNSWDNAGGSGNRLAGGTTMLPSDFATQFLTAHPTAAYRDQFSSTLAPFSGMQGKTPSMVPVNSSVTHMFIPGRGNVPVGQL